MFLGGINGMMGEFCFDAHHQENVVVVNDQFFAVDGNRFPYTENQLAHRRPYAFGMADAKPAFKCHGTQWWLVFAISWALDKGRALRRKLVVDPSKKP
jgi:hypothetical protein